MKRNLKALGLALVAVFALSAMTASAASAQQGLITSTTSPFWVHGNDEPAPAVNALTALGGRTECKVATYTAGKVNATNKKTGHHEGLTTGAVDFTIAPDYSGCTSGGGLPETVTMNGCDYVIHIGNTIGPHEYAVTADLVCPKGQEVTIDIFFTANHATPDCVIHIPPKNGIPGGTLKDETNGHLTLGGVFKPFSVTLTPGPCGEGTDPNATLDIAVTLEGKDKATEGKAVPLSLSHKG